MLGAAILTALMPATLFAQALAVNGRYRLDTFAKKDGRPLCSERWQFGGGGVLTVYSGQEIVHSQYRSVHDGDADWLVSTVVDSNGQPDCLGTTQSKNGGLERRVLWYLAADGGIVLCWPPAPGPTRVLDCFGHLVRPAREPDPAPVP